MHFKMIVADIDGCLTAGRNNLIDLKTFRDLQNLKKQSIGNLQYPWLAIITARPQPYLEAILQMIGKNVIGLFEWGCGLFLPNEYRCLFHPLLEKFPLGKMLIWKMKLSQYLEKEEVGFIQPGKEIAITVYPLLKDEDSLENLYQVLLYLLELEEPSLFEHLKIYKSRTFVNIMPKGINKCSGITWMLDEVNNRIKDIEITPKDCLGIGDGEDDLPFLKICGASTAPQNAVLSVKNEIDFCSDYSFGPGLIDCINHYLK